VETGNNSHRYNQSSVAAKTRIKEREQSRKKGGASSPANTANDSFPDLRKRLANPGGQRPPDMGTWSWSVTVTLQVMEVAFGHCGNSCKNPECMPISVN
jgi:hypothetical protein